VEFIEKGIPLWKITIWDKRFNNVDNEWQPKTIKYNYLLSDELNSIKAEDGDVRILYTGKEVGYTTEKLAGQNLSEGEIVSIPWGGIPSVKYHKGKFVTGDNRIATSSDVNRLTNKYLYYFLRGNIHEVASYYRGASLKHPNMKDILKMKISFPSIDIQEKICTQLDILESIIALRQKELLELDKLIRARFVEMFGDPIRNTQNRSTVDVVDVVKMQRGFDLPVQERNQMGKIPVYGSNGVLGYHDIPKVKGGGIITGRSGTIGKVLYTESDYWPLNTTLFSADTYGNDVIYLSYLMEMYDLSRFIEGTGVPTLNRNKFHNKKIINVSINEQTQFSAFVKEVNKSKIEVQKALDKAQLLFDSLMQKYFE